MALTNLVSAEPLPKLPLHELHGRRRHVRGAIAPGYLALKHHLPGGAGLNTLVGQSGAGEIAAQWLGRLPSLGRSGHSMVRSEAVVVGAQRLRERSPAGYA